MELTATLLLNDLYPPSSTTRGSIYHLLTVAYNKRAGGQAIWSKEGEPLWSKDMALALMFNYSTLPHFVKYVGPHMGPHMIADLEEAISLKQAQKVAGVLSNVMLKWDETDINALACYKDTAGVSIWPLRTMLNIIDPLHVSNICPLFFDDLKVSDIKVPYIYALIIICSIFRLAGFTVTLNYPDRFKGQAQELVMPPF